MKKLLLIKIILFSTMLVFSQDIEYGLNCGTSSSIETAGAKELKERYRSYKTGGENACLKKMIRVNIHFILRADGTGNFTENGDSNGPNTENGYTVARDIINQLNYKATFNPQLNIPPNNNLPALPKEYQFFLENVFFHRTDDSDYSTFDARFGEDTDEVMNVYFTYKQSSISGRANSIDITDETIPKWIIMYSSNGIVNSVDLLPGWLQKSHTLEHEFGHLLGLHHTVRYGFNVVPVEFMTRYNQNLTSCNIPMNTTFFGDLDGISDTPSPWEMYNDYGYTCHPACGWGGGNIDGCSNNLMDYAGSSHNALSPGQLEKINKGLLVGGNKRFLACRNVLVNQIFCSFGLPRIRYYGNKVKINECNSGTPNQVKDETHVYFNDETVIYENFEVFDQTSTGSYEVFEIDHLCACD